MSSHKDSGFTLIELLVVVAILAILAVIGATIYTSVQAGARDSRRKADIESIAKALEVNRNTQTEKYQSLSASNFQQQMIPTSTSQDKYCIASVISPSDPQLGTVYSWEEGTECPLVFPNTSAPFNEVTDANPPPDVTAWMLCARLETVVDTYCLTNSQ